MWLKAQGAAGFVIAAMAQPEDIGRSHHGQLITEDGRSQS